MQSLARALALLEALAEARGGIGLGELAARLGLPVSTAARLLSTLERRGYVEAGGGDGRWRVGLTAFVVGTAFQAARDLIELVRAPMHDLAARSGETVNLATLDGPAAVFIAQVPSRELMRMRIPLGTRVPAHASAAGKALLAALPAAELEARLGEPLEGFTPATLTDPGRLRVELARVRRRGYALDVEEHAVGLRCAGAAIHDEHGEGLAALSVSGPRARIGARRLALLGRWVGEAAMAASEALGGAPPGRIRRG